jgi:hypothetical protein
MGMGGGGMGGGGLGRGMMNLSQGGGPGGGPQQDPTAQNVPPLGGKGSGMGGGLGMGQGLGMGGGLPQSAAMSGSNRFAAMPQGAAGGAGAGGKGGAQNTAPMSAQHATERARANTEAIKATHSIIKHLIQQSGAAKPADFTSTDVYGDPEDLGRQVWAGEGIPGQGPW